MAAGPGQRLDDGSRGEMALKVGDEVIFGKYAGTEITIDEKDYTIMRVTDVLAKVVTRGAKGKGKRKK